MRKSELMFILFLAILKFQIFIFWKNIKFMMSSYMTKLEFLPEPYMMFRLEKPFSHICCLLCIEFSQVLLMPYERFVMLLKLRSRTHHPHMHYSYTGSRRNNMSFHLDSLKNVLLLHYEWTQKNPIGYILNKCSKFLLLSFKSFIEEKRHVAM
jgi:hypothetical protein